MLKRVSNVDDCTLLKKHKGEKEFGLKKFNQSSDPDDGDFIICKIDELTDALLIKVFENLSATQRICIERVCKRWNRCSKLAWMKFNSLDESSFTFNAKQLASKQLLTLIEVMTNNTLCQNLLSRCGKYLKSIDLHQCNKETLGNNILFYVAQFCPNLESIDVTNILLKESSINYLALCCFKLKSVSFGYCFPNIEIDVELSNLFQNCPQLTYLDLGGSKELNGTCFADLPVQLKHLDLSECNLGLDEDRVQVKSKK